MSTKSAQPDPSKIQQTLANAHQACQDMELVGQQLDAVITQLEQANHQQRQQVSQQI